MLSLQICRQKQTVLDLICAPAYPFARVWTPRSLLVLLVTAQQTTARKRVPLVRCPTKPVQSTHSAASSSSSSSSSPHHHLLPFLQNLPAPNIKIYLHTTSSPSLQHAHTFSSLDFDFYRSNFPTVASSKHPSSSSSVADVIL